MKKLINVLAGCLLLTTTIAPISYLSKNSQNLMTSFKQEAEGNNQELEEDQPTAEAEENIPEIGEDQPKTEDNKPEEIPSDNPIVETVKAEYNLTECTKIGYTVYQNNEVVIEKFKPETTKVPDVLPENITSLKDAFKELTSSTVSGIEKWNTSKIKDMTSIFDTARAFNQDISNWDISNVETMDFMFTRAEAFNQDISNWNTKNVKSMRGLFKETKQFNQNLNNWKTSNVTDMSSIFESSEAFNNKISNWDTSSVLYMSNMFQKTKVFDSQIGSWNTKKVIKMDNMFEKAEMFNQDISNWNTSDVTIMNSMFQETKQFNQNISNWDTSKVVNMNYMFASSEKFNQDISNWDTSNVSDMVGMFKNAKQFFQNLSKWNIAEIKDPKQKAWEFSDGSKLTAEQLPRWDKRLDSVLAKDSNFKTAKNIKYQKLDFNEYEVFGTFDWELKSEKLKSVKVNKNLIKVENNTAKFQFVPTTKEQKFEITATYQKNGTTEDATLIINLKAKKSITPIIIASSVAVVGVVFGVSLLAFIKRKSKK